MAQRICTVDGCEGPHRARGLCHKHYQRAKKQGDFAPGGCLPFPENLLQRMESQPNGCIHFTGYINPKGYGEVWSGSRLVGAHRSAYEHFVGPIPEGMTIDHECHNRDESCAGGPTCLHRRCVNWEHLAAKSKGENTLASPNTPASINAAKTHCKRGHEFTPENTYRDPKGSRYCRVCKAADASAYYRGRQVG